MQSEADKALADKARQAGTNYGTRGDAEKAFRERFSSKYTSKYEAEPAQRPSHIPQTTVVDNSTHTIVYERSRGGYGYYRGAEWVLYDSLRDAAIISALMRSNNYHYHAPAPAGVEAVGVSSDNTGIILLCVFAGVAVIVVIGVAVARS